MNQTCNNDQALVITGVPMLMGFARACINTRRALDHSDAFFDWCTAHPESPIASILSDHPAGQQWRELIIAQSLDMFADSGMNAVNWTATLIEALGQLSYLSSPIDQHIQFEGFDLVLAREPGPERHGIPPAHEILADLPPGNILPGFVSLTMDDVSRALGSASHNIHDIARLIEQLKPKAGRVEAGMLASSLLTLLAIGPLTGYANALVGGPVDPWHARLSWDLPEDLHLPSGDAIEILASPVED